MGRPDHKQGPGRWAGRNSDRQAIGWSVGEVMALTSTRHDYKAPRTPGQVKCFNAPKRTERELRRLREEGRLSGWALEFSVGVSDYRKACAEVGRPFRISPKQARWASRVLFDGFYGEDTDDPLTPTGDRD